MKLHQILVLAVLSLSQPSRAAENKYDVLARVIMPFANLLAQQTKNPNRALQLTVRLEAMTDLPEALAGTRAELALEYPDKLRLRGPVLGETLTICRRGRELWAFPGSKVEVLIKNAVAAKKLPRADPKARLEPFQLPVPEKQLVFLPALFRVADGGTEPLDGAPCRVLGLQLAPELERSLKQPGWSGRLWVLSNGAPARLVVEKPESQIAVRFERVAFSRNLPPSTWQPTPEESGDVLKLTAAQYQQLLSTIVK